MVIKTVFIIVVTVLTVFSAAFSTQNPGAENMILEGGKTGDVPFPHKLHQESQTGCDTCHHLFDQESGSIERLKSENILRAKQVMNIQCLKCHREMKKAGKPTGPVTCNTCHVKSNQDN